MFLPILLSVPGLQNSDSSLPRLFPGILMPMVILGDEALTACYKSSGLLNFNIPNLH